MAMLDDVKKSLWISGTDYNDELTRLINAACADLGFADVKVDSSTTDPALIQAIFTYVRMHFGSPGDYDRLKASYDEQKAQLQSSYEYGMKGRWLW